MLLHPPPCLWTFYTRGLISDFPSRLLRRIVKRSLKSVVGKLPLAWQRLPDQVLLCLAAAVDASFMGSTGRTCF